MKVYRNLCLQEILFIGWMVTSSIQFVIAADEIDRMLNVESSIQEYFGRQSESNTTVEPFTAKKAKPVRKTSALLVPSDESKINSQVTVLPDKQPEEPADSSMQQVKEINVPLLKSIVTEVPDSKPSAVVSAGPSLAPLREELMRREQELANANKEIERLKDIVKKILNASRRESLVFHYNMAAIYRASVMYKKAEEEYLKALAIDPDDAGVHYNLAILYDDNLKNKKKAKFHYERFLGLAPDDPDAPKVREWISSMIQ